MTRIKSVLTAVTAALVVTTSASADMMTFWKTTQCPNFEGKQAIARQVGAMEVPLQPNTLFGDPIDTIGGPYCNLFATPDDVVQPTKNRIVLNANVGDEDAAAVWACVVCQYPDKVIQWHGAAMPALSGAALALVGGVFGTLALVRLRRAQQTT